MPLWFKKDRNVQIPGRLVDPAFGEVNVQYLSGKKYVKATVLMEPAAPEGTQTGVGIDGSGSMVRSFGYTLSKRNNKLVIDQYLPSQNEVSTVSRNMIPYLAEQLDSDGGTTAIYWATGVGGASIEFIGDLTAQEAGRIEYKGPNAWGTGTKLLPAMRYLVERFKDAKWGFYVFITDGEIGDIDAVINYTVGLSRDIYEKMRNPVKCVLIGVGPEINEDQMSILDDLNETHDTPIDIWDHKIAATMRDLKDIFAEVVDESMIVAPFGRIIDDQGSTIKEYPDGVPTILRFQLREAAESFTLQLTNASVVQTLQEK